MGGRLREPAEGPRARLHASFAAWLEATGEGGDDQVAALAHHYSQAVEPEIAMLAWRGEEAKLAELSREALRYLRRGAELAVGRFDIEEALALLRRAVELAPEDAELWRAIARAGSLIRRRGLLGGDAEGGRADERFGDPGRPLRRARHREHHARLHVETTSGRCAALELDRPGPSWLLRKVVLSRRRCSRMRMPRTTSALADRAIAIADRLRRRASLLRIPNPLGDRPGELGLPVAQDSAQAPPHA